MKQIEIDTPSIFPDNIIAGVTRRNEHYKEEMPLSMYRGNILDDDEVENQREEFQSHLNSGFLMFQRQIHSDDIRIIEFDSTEEKSDGMVCSQEGLILNVSIADCCAILIYDPINKVIAGLHSGWQGSKLKIAKKGIELLANRYNSDPQHLLVYLSACASGEQYEVGEEFCEFFPDNTVSKGKGKYLFDNKKEILGQLLSAGVREAHIEISPVCTISDIKYHSYRRDGQQSGRMTAFIGMKD